MAASRSITCKQRIFAETLKQAEDVIDGQPPFAAVNQLHSTPVLQIDAGNDQIAGDFGCACI